MTVRHFLEVDDLSVDELRQVLDAARQPSPSPVLAGKGMALVFQKPSARTRNSMEMAVVQLGGHPLTIRHDEIDIDRRESAEDVALTLGGYHAAIGARVFDHGVLERMASVSPVPVVNLLSDRGHPLQALADLLTIEDEFGSLIGRSVAYIGDGNNVAFSLALAGGLMGMDVRIATPPNYQLDEVALDRIRATGAAIDVGHRPEEAAAGADVLYTDVWASMGQEEEAEERRRAFEGFTIDESIMELAAEKAILLHCLPAHRGEEVAAAVVDGSQSRVWPQAANRMHAARGLLCWLLEHQPGERS
jgi:ornithine carbamoyltransferase